MQLSDKLLSERVVKQFNQVEVVSEEMEEVYESCSRSRNLSYSRIKKDGTVVSTKIELKRKEVLEEITDVSGWQDIIAIATGENCTVGLKSDGTLIGTGCSFYRKEVSEVCDWKLF